MSLAVILTCYNRKEKTINCINKLLPQLKRMGGEFRFYICDDYSTDGTYEELRALLPKHEVFQSEGNYYWCKGMHAAMWKAAENGYDLYLMVNDDVDFFDDALETMLRSYRKSGQACGITGSTMEIGSERHTYGGTDQAGNPVVPNGEIVQCYWTNWNCFLTDKTVIRDIGIIDGKYQHAYGDYDYAYRMKKTGYNNYIADAYIGRCNRNAVEGTYRDKNLTKQERLKKLFSAKGEPFYSYMRYHIRTQGIWKIPYYLYGYVSIVGYIIWGKDLK